MRVEVRRAYRVKRPAPKVLDADGAEIRVGETVYLTGLPTAFVVDRIEYEGGGTPNVYFADGSWAYTDLITHERPDSWERLEEDAGKSACDYFGHPVADGLCEECSAYTYSTPQGRRGCRYAQMADIVHRAKALAERGR